MEKTEKVIKKRESFSVRNFFITFADEKNELFSFLLNENVTNIQAIMAMSTLFSVVTTIAVSESITLMILSIIWFLASLYGCKKYKMLED